MFTLLKHWFTERDNETWCLARTVLSTGAVSMIYKFVVSVGVCDYQSFGIGLSAIAVGIAAKNYSEK